MEKDDEDFLNYWLEQQPELSKEEQIIELERLNKNAEIILKSGITPNMDTMY